jgi:copper chaperone NosL
MRAIVLITLTLALAGCAAPKPVNVVTGEACWRCRYPINDAALAGQLVADNGLASKFRTVHCMATWIGQQKTSVKGDYYVTDFVSRKWIDAEDATYVYTIVNRNTMARDYLAFADRAEAEKKASADGGTLATWSDVLERGRTEPLP